MTTYIALLRGINVSGQNSIRMSELQDSFSTLGFKDIQTYLQSGNVVFDSQKSDEDKLAAIIQAEIFQAYGHVVPVLVMSAKVIDDITSSNQLWPKTGGDEKLFHCTFLFKPVSQDLFRALKLPALEGECAVLVGQVVLLHCPHGYGKAKLNNSYFERALGVSATTRNWRTVLALQALCASR